MYNCRDGALHLTLLPKATHILRVLLDGRLVLRRAIAGVTFWDGTIPIPSDLSRDSCVFTIVGQQLLGSTRISFERHQ